MRFRRSSLSSLMRPATKAANEGKNACDRNVEAIHSNPIHTMELQRDDEEESIASSASASSSSSCRAMVDGDAESWTEDSKQEEVLITTVSPTSTRCRNSWSAKIAASTKRWSIVTSSSSKCHVNSNNANNNRLDIPMPLPAHLRRRVSFWQALWAPKAASPRHDHEDDPLPTLPSRRRGEKVGMTVAFQPHARDQQQPQQEGQRQQKQQQTSMTNYESVTHHPLGSCKTTFTNSTSSASKSSSSSSSFLLNAYPALDSATGRSLSVNLWASASADLEDEMTLVSDLSTDLVLLDYNDMYQANQYHHGKHYHRNPHTTTSDNTLTKPTTSTKGNSSEGTYDTISTAASDVLVSAHSQVAAATIPPSVWNIRVIYEDVDPHGQTNAADRNIPRRHSKAKNAHLSQSMRSISQSPLWFQMGPTTTTLARHRTWDSLGLVDFYQGEEILSPVQTILEQGDADACFQVVHTMESDEAKIVEAPDIMHYLRDLLLTYSFHGNNDMDDEPYDNSTDMGDEDSEGGVLAYLDIRKLGLVRVPRLKRSYRRALDQDRSTTPSLCSVRTTRLEADMDWPSDEEGSMELDEFHTSTSSDDDDNDDRGRSDTTKTTSRLSRHSSGSSWFLDDATGTDTWSVAPADDL